MANNNVVVRQTEKPNHYNYLKSFRVEQCADFVNFQCSKHKPFTCFKWHFPNQKRRRPVLNRDGRFNYSADQYCTKYDEFSGTCSDKDACSLLHKTVGDTEHLYHLRCYKVELCSGSVNTQGNCDKNGLHCAFAHGASDVRQAVIDLNEQHIKYPLPNEKSAKVESQQGVEGEAVADTHAGADRNLFCEESPWNDTRYMLSNFKTQECSLKSSSSHPTTLCPHYHSVKEHRRSFEDFKYSSVACPLVKDKEEWGDPGGCHHGDACNYSHTANETYYHPDVFRRKGCTREQVYGHCFKAVFCPFSHSKTPDLSSTTTSPTPSPPVSVLSSSSSSSLYTEPISSISSGTFVDVEGGEVVVVSSSSLEDSLGKEEHFYDVLDAISDYKISPELPPGSNMESTPDNDQACTNHVIDNIPYTNNVVFINKHARGDEGEGGEVGSSELDCMGYEDQIPKEQLIDAVQELSLYHEEMEDSNDAKRPSFPPGFEKMMAENKELVQLREEKNELQRRLQGEAALKEKALKERDKALSLLETFKMHPPLDDKRLLHYLTEGSKLKALTLASLFKLHSKLNEDVSLLNKLMDEALASSDPRCSRCHTRAGRMLLSCGHSCYCYACYISQVVCPQCCMPVFNY